MKRIAFMFPGQGSQAVGMGQKFYEEYPEIQTLYEEANQVLNEDITNLMFEGPEDVLRETENAQPALLLSSIAIQRILLKERVLPVLTIGHSLGEYSALVAANALSLQEALPLVKTRGKLMEEALPKGRGAMVAVLGMSQEAVEDVLGKLPADTIVDIANLNCPGQIVISGTVEGLAEATVVLKENGARRVIPLNVSGPFHSRLMQPASEKFSESLDKIEFNEANIPVYANVTASPVTNSKDIKQLLIQQLYLPVRFEESVEHIIKADIDALVEVGNGKVLSGLVRKIDRNMRTFSIQDPESMQEFISWYREES